MLVKDSLSIASIFILFIVSFYQRQPHLSNQTDANDVANLQTLTTLDIWRQQSPTYFSFLPVQSYQNQGDKNIHYYPRFKDKKGNNYYVSYPPLCYILPYSIHLLGFETNRKLLVWINILLHLISTIFLFYLLKSMLNQKRFSWNILASISYFVLIPVMTYSYTRMYFAETLGLSLFIACVYFLHQILFSNPKSNLNLLGFAVSFTLLSYSEWISAFLLICLCAYLFYNKTLEKKIRFRLFIIAIICFITPLILFLIQLLSLNSFSEGFHSLSIRLLERSGWFGQKYSSNGISIFNLSSIYEYLKLFINAVGIIGVCMILIGLIFRFLFPTISKENKAQKIFILVLVFAPILLHNLIFFNANALHYHLQIKWIFLISLLWGFVSTSEQIKTKVNWTIQIITICILLFIQIYTPRFKPINDEFLTKIADQITHQTITESALFANIHSEPPTPFNLAYLSYLTKRNFASANDSITARNESLKLNYKSFYFIEGEQSNNRFTIFNMRN